MTTAALATAAIAATLAAATLAATPALAVDVTRSVPFTGDAAAAWAVAGPFCAIGDWHPVVETCTETVVGGRPQRTLALKGGGTIVEAEVSRDEAARTYTYAIVESPLPVADYTSTLTVGDGAIEWTGTFTAKGATDEEAAGVIAGIYEAGLAGIAEAMAK